MFAQVSPPGVWFAFNMTVCFTLCFLLKKFMNNLALVSHSQPSQANPPTGQVFHSCFTC